MVGTRTNLTTDSTALATQPSWSPSSGTNANKIAFIWMDDGNREVWVMDTDGTNKKQVTCTTTSGGATVNHRRPDWSPNGQWIAFSANRKDGNDEDVYAVKYTGSDCNSATIPVYPLTTSQNDEEFVTWYREGSQYKVTYTKKPTSATAHDIQLLNVSLPASGTPSVTVLPTPTWNSPQDDTDPDW